MAEFAIGDLVRVKGCVMVMCIESIASGPDGSVLYAMWFDYVGALHRDGFDPRCLERAFIQQAVCAVLPYEGIVR